MKTIFYLLSYFLIPTSAFSQHVPTPANINNVWYPAFKNGKMGYINSLGQGVANFTMQPLAYYDLKSYENDFIIIKSDEVKGAFSKNAKQILDYKFVDIDYCDLANLFRVALKADNYDKEPYQALLPPKKIGFYTLAGVEQIKPKLMSGGFYDCGYDFYNDLCYVSENKKIGYINTKGVLVIPTIYTQASDFKNGFAIVQATDKGLFGVIDTKGKLVIPYTYKNIGSFSTRGIALANIPNNKVEQVLINTKGKIIKNLGNIVVGNLVNTLYKFDNGSFIASDTTTKKFGLINEKGEAICPFKYSGVTNSLTNNILIANINGTKSKDDWWNETTGGSWVLVNTVTGKEICQPIAAEKLGVLSDGMVAFMRNGKWGFLNSNGKEIIKPTYGYVQAFEFGLARVFNKKPSFMDDGPPQMGYINKTGEIVWEIQ